MKRTHKIISLVCTLIFTLNFLTVISVAGGTGTEADPYIITTATELQNINNNVSAHYRLGANIDLAGVDFVPIGNVDSGAFSGSFDGNGYTIKNLDVFSSKFAGLFGSNEGIIKNVTLEDIYVYGTRYIGGVVAHNTSFGIIENCKVISGLVETDGGINDIQIGGICGLNEGAFIGGSSNGADIEATDSDVDIYAGGVCGYWNSDITKQISNFHNTGNVSSYTVRGDSYSGGIVGSVYNTLTLSNCYNTGNITTSTLSTNYSGGIIGDATKNSVTVRKSYNSGIISSVAHINGYSGGITGFFGNINNCYNTGYIVSSTSKTGTVVNGGISGCGENIENCYNTGNIFTSSEMIPAQIYSGGISGKRGNIKNCYNTGNISAVENGVWVKTIGGIVGSTESASLLNCYTLKGTTVFSRKGCSGNFLGDDEMKKQSSFIDWDFRDIWSIDNNVNTGYPILKNTNCPLSLNITNKTMVSGEAIQLKAYKNGFETNAVSWSVTNGNSVVSSNGLVRVGVGLSTITATDNDGNKVNLNIYGYEKAISINGVNKKINLNVSFASGVLGFKINGSESDYIVDIKNSNPSIIMHNESVDTYKCISTGEVQFTATTLSGLTATTTITVTDTATSISLPEEFSVNIGKTGIITVETSPNPTSSSITWKSFDETIAMVDNYGNVTGLKGGTTIITATTDNGYSDYCTVTVKVPVTKMEFDIPSITLYPGETFNLKLNITPINTTDTITYSSSSTSRATVSSKGLVTAKATTGNVTITATSSSGQKAYCNITIKSWPDAMSAIDSTTTISNRYIITDADSTVNIKDLVIAKDGYSITATPSQSAGGKKFFGTGSTVDVYNEYGNLVITYTLVVNGDTNGDSVVDALDAAQVASASSGLDELTGAYAKAADSNSDDIVDIDDYQAIINKVVS